MRLFRHCEEVLRRSNPGCESGFTLIELLISLVIFSLISIAALGSVNHMMRAREQQVLHHAHDQALDKAYAHLFQDMLWFVGEVQATEPDLFFTRSQTSQEGGQSRVLYQVIEGKLWRVLNDRKTLLLGNVKDLRLTWLLKNNQWVGAFDQISIPENPVLFKLEFTDPNLGEVQWVFAVPQL